jgi:hypothetical protein
MMQLRFIYDCTPRFVHFAYKFTGKERGGLSRMRWAFWPSRLPMMHVDK